MSLDQYTTSPWLTPVRVVATTNQTGMYMNGQSNNGVGATFVYPTGILVIDEVTINFGDRILFANQTLALQNGIYVCNQVGTDLIPAILKRADDQQCIEQLNTGFYVSVSAGSANAGDIYTLVEPKPFALGISPMLWQSVGNSGGGAVIVFPVNNGNFCIFDGTAGAIKDAGYAPTNASFSKVVMTSGSPVTVNNLAAFYDASGSIKDSGLETSTVPTFPGHTGVTISYGFNLSITGSGTGPYTFSCPGASTLTSAIFVSISTGNNPGPGVSQGYVSATNVGAVTFTAAPDSGTLVAYLLINATS